MIDLMKCGRHDWRIHWVEKHPDGREELRSERFDAKHKAIKRLEELRLYGTIAQNRKDKQ